MLFKAARPHQGNRKIVPSVPVTLGALLGHNCQEKIFYCNCVFLSFFFSLFTEAPIEEIAVVKKNGKLYVDAFDGSGENIVTADQPISESGTARKLRQNRSYNSISYLYH